MEIPLMIVLASHLSDVQERPNDPMNRIRLNFVKFLLNKYNCKDYPQNPLGDRFFFINADKDFAEFEAKHPQCAKIG